jgi:hypothetical protein
MKIRICPICEHETTDGIVCNICWNTNGYDYCIPFVNKVFDDSYSLMKQLDIPYSESSICIIDLYQILMNKEKVKKLIFKLQNKAFL